MLCDIKNICIQAEIPTLKRNYQLLSGNNGFKNKYDDASILPILHKCLHAQSSFSGSLRKAGALFKNDTVRFTSSPAFRRTWTWNKKGVKMIPSSVCSRNILCDSKDLEMIGCLFASLFCPRGEKHFIKIGNELHNIVGIQPSPPFSSHRLVVPCSLTMSSSSVHIHRYLLRVRSLLGNMRDYDFYRKVRCSSLYAINLINIYWTSITHPLGHIKINGPEDVDERAN